MSTEELMKRLDALKKERTQLRRVFTVAATRLGEAWDQEASHEECNKFYAQFLDKASRLLKNEDSVSALILAVETDESVISNEFDVAEGYRDTHAEIVAKWELVNQKARFDVTSSHSLASPVRTKSSLKLPKIVPYQFDGQLKNWICFWSVFKRIDQSDEYDDSEKFQYLLMYTKEGSPARELVESFPPLDKNYAKVVARLKARFGRDELLIEMYVRELLALVLIRNEGGSAYSLSKLYNQLETQIKALESLGVASDKYTYLLTPLIESALPDHILKDWERASRSQVSLYEVSDTGDLEARLSHLTVKDKNPPNLEVKLHRLLAFIRDEVEREECLILKRNAFQDSIGSAGSNDGKSHKAKAHRSEPFSRVGMAESSGQPVQTATGLLNVKDSKSSCIFCSGSHASESCVKCYDFSADQIKQKLSEFGRCFLCFRKGHKKMKCRAVIKCLICSKRHNLILCDGRQVRLPLSSETSPGTLNHDLSNTHPCPILLQTLRVTLRGKRDIVGRVLIDCGSQKSYATRRVLSLLDYRPTHTESLVHTLFGGTTKPEVHKCYKLQLASLDRTYLCNFDVLDTETICLSVPAPGNEYYTTELKKKGISLTDCGDGPIDVLIGADIAGKLWTGRREVLHSGLVAIETLLGWTLMGKTTGSAGTFETHIGMMCTEASPDDLRRLEVMGMMIEDPAEKLSKGQSLQLGMGNSSTGRLLHDGRNQVNLPWENVRPPLRFDGISRKLKVTGRETAYPNVLLDRPKDGIPHLASQLARSSKKTRWRGGDQYPLLESFNSDLRNPKLWKASKNVTTDCGRKSSFPSEIRKG